MDISFYLDRYLRQDGRKTAALFYALRDAISSGRLPGGSRLPPSRKLADMYGVSRGTVNVVYDMLAAEGYVSGQVGRGTFVSVYDAGKHSIAGAMPLQDSPQLSSWGRRLVGDGSLHAPRQAERISFALGRVDTGRFPWQEWMRLVHAELRAASRGHTTDAYATEGNAALRALVAGHLRRARGIDADPEHVVIVNGSQQAISLTVQLLVDSGDPVIAENPGYQGIRKAIAAAGGAATFLPVDESGIVFDFAARAKLLIVTPARQFPTGAVLSLSRRLQLLDWAAERRAYIVEDDYDSEFRRKGRPIEPLKSLDKQGRVIHIGTFSRTMYNDIRLGYAVVPPSLLEPFRLAKQLYETHPSSVIEQRALAAFMKSGAYERHLRAMNRSYKRRAELLAAQLKEQMSAHFKLAESDAGLHLYAEWLGDAASFTRFQESCRLRGVVFTDASVYYAREKKPSACFGFAHVSEESITEGVRIMAEAASSLAD